MQSKAKTRPIRSDAVLDAQKAPQTAIGAALQYRPALMRFFQRRSTLFASEAEDLTQEVFLRLLQRSHGDREITRLEGYIFQVASSVLVDRARKAASRGGDHLLFEETAHATEANVRPDRLIEGRQDIEVVKAALRRLPDSPRNAFLLSRFEGLSYAEIAAGMGVSVSSVEKYIMRALHEIGVALAASGGRQATEVLA